MIVFAVALFMCCAALHIRQVSPAVLFLVFTGLLHVFGLLLVLTPKTLLLTQAGVDRANHDTYYVIVDGIGVLTVSVLMLGLTAVVWLQQRHGAMLYPRITRWLIWPFVAYAIYSGLAVRSLGPPRRYVEYEDFVRTQMLAETFVTVPAIISFGTLLLLAAWSFAQRWRSPSA